LSRLLLDLNKTAIPKTITQHPPPTSGINRVLIIDNDKSFHKVIIQKLEAFAPDSSTQSIYKSEDAINKILLMQTLTNNDIIFVNVEMTGMSGIHFLEKLNTLINKQEGRPRVFIASSSLDHFVINKSQKFNFVEDFIPKPLLDDDLRALM